MNRREALSAVSVLLGGTIIGSDLFLSGCRSAASKVEGLPLNKAGISLMDEIGETIIPTTATSPGAKAAKIGEFINMYVKDCYDVKDQKIFVDGINTLQADCEKKYGKSFIDLDAAQKKELLTAIDTEQKAYKKAMKKDDQNHYFNMLKQLTILGYFTSEVGATKALRYLQVPGKYDGALPYKKGDKAWALS
jgi:hypothetical protein